METFEVVTHKDNMFSPKNLLILRNKVSAWNGSTSLMFCSKEGLYKIIERTNRLPKSHPYDGGYKYREIRPHAGMYLLGEWIDVNDGIVSRLLEKAGDPEEYNISNCIAICSYGVRGEGFQKFVGLLKIVREDGE